MVESDENVMDVMYGEWEDDVGVTVFQNNIWRRRTNLQGHELRYANFKK